MRRLLLSVSLAAGIALSSSSAAAGVRIEGQVQYLGVHPLTAAVDDGFCYIEVPHVHVTAPPKKARVMYRVIDDQYHFVADPVPFGWDGPKYSYYGHHPVPVEVIVGAEPAYVEGQPLEYCYLEGPHYHHWEPPPGLTFTVEADAHWYIGELGPDYREHKRRYGRINVFYEPIVYTRPVVVVETPPVGYVGPFVDVHVDAPAVVAEPRPVRASAGVDVDVRIPVPTFSLEVGGGVIVDDHHHHHKHKKHKKFRKRHRKHKNWRWRH